MAASDKAEATSAGKKVMLEPRMASTQAALVLSGPEVGFSDAEEALALQAGFVPQSLGARTLRAETAALTALALLA